MSIQSRENILGKTYPAPYDKILYVTPRTNGPYPKISGNCLSHMGWKFLEKIYDKLIYTPVIFPQYASSVKKWAVKAELTSKPWSLFTSPKITERFLKTPKGQEVSKLSEVLIQEGFTPIKGKEQLLDKVNGVLVSEQSYGEASAFLLASSKEEKSPQARVAHMEEDDILFFETMDVFSQELEKTSKYINTNLHLIRSEGKQDKENFSKIPFQKSEIKQCHIDEIEKSIQNQLANISDIKRRLLDLENTLFEKSGRRLYDKVSFMREKTDIDVMDYIKKNAEKEHTKAFRITFSYPQYKERRTQLIDLEKLQIYDTTIGMIQFSLKQDVLDAVKNYLTMQNSPQLKEIIIDCFEAR